MAGWDGRFYKRPFGPRTATRLSSPARDADTLEVMTIAPRALLAGAAACALAFLVLLAAAYGSDRAWWLDAAALEGFRALELPGVAGLNERIALLANPTPFALLAAALVLVGLAGGRPRHAAAAGLLLGGANITTQVLKPLLAEPRAADLAGQARPIVEAFPSGHATAAMSLALAAVLVAPRRLRPLVAAGGGAFCLAVSFSILALGWHFPSDAVAGYLVAAAWALMAAALVRLSAESRPATARQLKPERSPAPPAPVMAMLSGVAVVALAVAIPLAPKLVSYAERYTAFAAVAAAMTVVAATLLAATVAAARVSSRP